MNSLELKTKMEDYWNCSPVKSYSYLNAFTINKYGNLERKNGTKVKFKTARKRIR